MSNEELKPCPRCGPIDELLIEDGSTHRWIKGSCPECELSLGDIRRVNTFDNNPKPCIDYWNDSWWYESRIAELEQHLDEVSERLGRDNKEINESIRHTLSTLQNEWIKKELSLVGRIKELDKELAEAKRSNLRQRVEDLLEYTCFGFSGKSEVLLAATHIISALNLDTELISGLTDVLWNNANHDCVGYAEATDWLIAHGVEGDNDAD